MKCMYFNFEQSIWPICHVPTQNADVLVVKTQPPHRFCNVPPEILHKNGTIAR